MDCLEGDTHKKLVDLARQLGQTLARCGWMLATAESCTGGMLAGLMTEVPGASAWFSCGWVTYSNASKIQLLGVPAEMIEVHGAVSEAVVCAMAESARQRSQAQMAVAISGIAGPGGGTTNKPVGMVCLGWAWDGYVESVTQHFSGDRSRVRSLALCSAMVGATQRVQRACFA
ncbi:MAG: CinA family protein [Betaproteobacteria bacterium]|jgi:competence/damage-inducible protein CinA C-terminal domain|nr:CinA family protein [Betaproteobacteria bacterium]